MALTLASGRHLDDFARNQPEGRWESRSGIALADRRMLIIGYGHIGQAIERRLAGFEVASITRVARRARDGEPRVHATDELPDLLPHADVVIVIAPLTPETEGLIDAELLALLPDGALLVNVARGKLVDTDALVAETGSRPAAGRARRHRARTAAPRSPALADPERADLTARRRGQLRVLPAGRPAGRRPVAAVRQRGTTR